jgi:hypothetical protein
VQVGGSEWQAAVFLAGPEAGKEQSSQPEASADCRSGFVGLSVRLPERLQATSGGLLVQLQEDLWRSTLCKGMPVVVHDRCSGTVLVANSGSDSLEEGNGMISESDSNVEEEVSESSGGEEVMSS